MSVLMGAFYGALILVPTSALFSTWFEPQATQDGQSVLLLVAAGPVGALLGGFTALVLAQKRRGDGRAASQVAIAAGISGFVLGVATTLSVATLYSLGLGFWGIATWPRN